ncbi:MAG: DUF58 domain-containing protein [Thermoguttaceae bacterium]|nr:DUF58 domain-containing protein [Thermoguttaceae bacterium]
MNSQLSDILKKVRRLEIISNRSANDLFAGEYKSVFRGQGMEFSEVREYQPGDDVRLVDWNVTARAGRPYIKRFVEERELTILFMLDVSASGIFGSVRGKLDTAVETAATLMFSALKNNDKVGLLTFCDEVIGYQPPRKGKGAVLRLIREMVAQQPVCRPTDLAKALEYANRVLKRRAVIFFMSDFFAPQADRQLALCRRKHDLIALRLTDPRETAFPNIGFVTLRDPETGETAEVDTASPRVRALLAERFRRQRDSVAGCLKHYGIDEMPIATDRDYVKDLRRFFEKRRGRKHP